MLELLQPGISDPAGNLGQSHGRGGRMVPFSEGAQRTSGSAEFLAEQQFPASNDEASSLRRLQELSSCFQPRGDFCSLSAK